MKVVQQTCFALGGCSFMSCSNVRKQSLSKDSQHYLFPKVGFSITNMVRCVCHSGHGKGNQRKMKSQEDVWLWFLLPGQEGLGELLGLRQITLQPFFSITHCPSTLSLPQPGPYHPPRRNFLLTPDLHLPSFSLKPFPLVLVSHSLLLCVDLGAVAAALWANTPGVCQEQDLGTQGPPSAWDLLPYPCRAPGEKLSSHLGRRDLFLSCLSYWELHFSLLLLLSISPLALDES